MYSGALPTHVLADLFERRHIGMRFTARSGETLGTSIDTSLKRATVLDPGERVQEIVFGVLMAVTVTGSFSVASGGGQQIATMLTAAVGCNLAWGVTDAVTYLVGTAIERTRLIRLLQRVQAARDPREAQRLIAKELPVSLAAFAHADTLEALRQRLIAVPLPPSGLRPREFAGALGVFALVVAATLPVVVPFIVVKETGLAMRISNGLALTTLFAAGFFLGRYAGGSPWRYGIGITAIGAALVAMIIALGG